MIDEKILVHDSKVLRSYSFSNIPTMPGSVSSLNSTIYTSSAPADAPSIGRPITHASQHSSSSLSTMSSRNPQSLSIPRIRILLAPYMSPFVVPVHRVETWEVSNFNISEHDLKNVDLMFITASSQNTPNLVRS